MKLLVLGAGLQGCACAYDLLQSPAVTQVTLADLRPEKLPPFLTRDWGGRLHTVRLDVSDSAAVRAAFSGHAAVMSAIPYYYNGPMARAAVWMIRNCSPESWSSQTTAMRRTSGAASRSI